MHGWDNQKLEEYHILSHISYAWNTFADLGMFVYAICHSEVSPVRTMYLYESFDYSLRNCKVLQICNIIQFKGIRMLGWLGILRTEDVWERNIPFEVAPILTIFLCESERMFLLSNICLKCLGCMYKKSKASKVSEICNIIHINGIHMLRGGGGISEWGVFDNAICRSGVVTFLTMYLYEPY